MAALYGLTDLDRILALAKHFPVFPCNDKKRPLVPGGFHAASRDPAQIRAWWREWPEALVGVPTGQTSGLVVIDYDPAKATAATHSWIAERTGLLTSTRVHDTRSDGKHYLFRSTARYQTGTNLILDGSPRRGIDLRANGGYVIWWPAHGGRVTGEDIAPLPAGLIDERLFRPERDMAPLPAAPGAWELEAHKVAAALRFLSPDGYDPWIKVGMAIHAASGGSDAGFALWHDWSATGESYDGIEDCRYHWASFGRYDGRQIGLGSLFQLARANGYGKPDPADYMPPDAEPPETEQPPPEGEPATEPGAIVLRPLYEIVAERREPEWLLDDVIEANVLAVLAGPRSTFKSFVALDWAMRIAATGRPVVILSGEGAGIDRRADAWTRTHGGGRDITEFPVFVLERPLNLNQDTDMVLLKAAVERLGQSPALVVVDTFSKFSAGLDENDNGEVSTYLSRLSQHIRQSFGSTVLLVAHSGHGDAARPRGASALMANPDAEYIVARPSPTDMNVTVSRERFKDCPALAPLGYEAQVIDLGRLDRRGQAVTSLALVPGTPVVATVKGGGKNQQALLVALKEYHRNQPESRFLSSAEIAAMCKQQGIPAKRKPEVLNWLVNAGVLTASIGGHTFDPSNL